MRGVCSVTSRTDAVLAAGTTCVTTVTAALERAERVHTQGMFAARLFALTLVDVCKRWSQWPIRDWVAGRAGQWGAEAGGFFPIERSFTRILIVGLEVKAPKKRRVEGRKRTRWWKLKED